MFLLLRYPLLRCEGAKKLCNFPFKCLAHNMKTLYVFAFVDISEHWMKNFNIFCIMTYPGGWHPHTLMSLRFCSGRQSHPVDQRASPTCWGWQQQQQQQQQQQWEGRACCGGGNVEGVRQVPGPGHWVQDGDSEREHDQQGPGLAPPLQVSDEAPGPQAVLSDDGRDSEKDRDPNEEDDGAGWRREAGPVEVVQPLGRVQVQHADEEGGPGESVRQCPGEPTLPNQPVAWLFVIRWRSSNTNVCWYLTTPRWRTSSGRKETRINLPSDLSLKY